MMIRWSLERALEEAQKLADSDDGGPVLIMEDPGYGYVVGLRTDFRVRQAGKHVGTMNRYNNLDWGCCVKDIVDGFFKRCLCS